MDIRPNRLIQPEIPDGFLLACACYGVGPYAHRATFLAFDQNKSAWVTGDWDASVPGGAGFLNLLYWKPTELGKGEACNNFVGRAAVLLRAYPGNEATA